MLDLMTTTNTRLDTVRRNLKVACAIRDITPSELARRAGLSRNAVSQFIAGRTSMSHGNLLMCCDILNVPIGILHRPDAMTENRIRLFNILERMPDHLSHQALEAVAEIARHQQRDFGSEPDNGPDMS